MLVDRNAASYLHGERKTIRSHYRRSAHWKNDFIDMNERGWIPQNIYETRNIETKRGSGGHKHAYQYFYDVNLYTPKDYFETLNLQTVPQEYIKMLCLYRSFGLELSPGYNSKYTSYFEWELVKAPDERFISGIPEIKRKEFIISLQSPSVIDAPDKPQTIPVKYVINDGESYNLGAQFHGGTDYKAGKLYSWVPILETYPGYNQKYRFHYILSLFRFKELIDTYYLKEVYSLLNTAQLEDLPTVESYYSNLINRTTKDIDRLIDSEVSTIVRFGNLNKENHYKCSIPKRIDIYEFTNLIPYNLQYLIEKDPGGIQFINPRKVLREIWKQALSLVAQNIDKVAGRLAQLQDPDSKLTRTDFQEDPYRNPFLVYNKEKSKESGEAVFENVATNQSLSMKDLQKYYTSELTPPKYLDMSEMIRQTYERKTDFDNINKISTREIRELAGTGPEKKKSNILPMLFLTGGAAFTIWQATQ